MIFLLFNIWRIIFFKKLDVLQIFFIIFEKIIWISSLNDLLNNILTFKKFNIQAINQFIFYLQINFHSYLIFFQLLHFLIEHQNLLKLIFLFFNELLKFLLPKCLLGFILICNYLLHLNNILLNLIFVSRGLSIRNI